MPEKFRNAAPGHLSPEPKALKKPELMFRRSRFHCQTSRPGSRPGLDAKAFSSLFWRLSLLHCYCWEVLKIHANPITKHGDIDYEAICKLTDNFNNADMRNICTEVSAPERQYSS